MTKNQKSKAQLLAEALGTTSEKAKLFGDQVNQQLSRGGHPPEPFAKICEVVRTNSDRVWDVDAVVDALRSSKTPGSNLTSVGASPRFSNMVRTPVVDNPPFFGSIRSRISEADVAEIPQIRQRLSAMVDESVVPDGRSDPKTTLGKPTAAPTPTYSPDAHKIRQFVADREIPYLVHLTTMENFRGICRAGAILAVNELRQKKLVYKPHDSRRLDRHPDFINCSIGYYNFLMFYPEVYKSRTHDVLLHVRPDYLWFSKTRFCPVNAATDNGEHVGSGFGALESMYQENVGSQTRDGKPSWLPTNIQAEVLVYQRIPIEDILSVVVRGEANASMVRHAGWTGKVTAQSAHFEYRQAWLSKAPTSSFELE